MLTNVFKTSSALALIAAMAAPPAMADDVESDLPRCDMTGENTEFPCALKNGREVENAKQLAKILARRATKADGEADGEADGAEAVDTAPEGGDGWATAPDAPDVVDAPEEGGETPADTPAEKPADKPAQKPADKPAEKPADKPADKPAAAAPSTDDTAPAGFAATRPQGGGAAAAAQAADADELLADPEAGDVVTETVTEADVRESDEDFATAPTASGGEAFAPDASGGGDDSFQKGLLLGLGALAVGAVLYNGAKVISNSGDRVVVEQPDGTLTVMKNDDEILRRPGSEVRTRTFDDGSTRTVVTRENGVKIITIRAADGTTLKRVRVLANGDRVVLFDDTVAAQPVTQVPVTQPPAPGIIATDREALRAALMASMSDRSDRRYALGQVRAFKQVRALAPEIEVRAITFATNSAAIPPAQAERLADLGLAIAGVIADVPGAVFLVEGHTDAIGSGAYNLALSDRRAESVALALGEYFGVPPENLVTQGYGESDLKIDTQEANRQNRRVVVRNITPLLQ